MVGTTEIYTIFPDADGTVWVGTADGIVRHTPRIPKNYLQEFSALVRTASGLDGKRVYFGGAGNPGPLSLSLRRQILCGFVSLRPRLTTNPARSIGCTWRASTGPGLPGRKRPARTTRTCRKELYVFRVEARNLYGATSRQDSYAFTLLSAVVSHLVGLCA